MAIAPPPLTRTVRAPIDETAVPLAERLSAAPDAAARFNRAAQVPAAQPVADGLGAAALDLAGVRVAEV